MECGPKDLPYMFKSNQGEMTVKQPKSAAVNILVGATSSLIGPVLATTYLPLSGSKNASGIGGIAATLTGMTHVNAIARRNT